MHLLYCDETNFQKLSGDFFVYGGIVIDGSKAAALADELAAIRKSFSVKSEFLLKFNPGPEGMSHTDFIGLKQAYMAAAAKYEVKLLVNLLLHDIASDSDTARRNGINTLCFHFDCLLNRLSSPGLVLIDRFNDKKLDDHLNEKIAVGLTGKLPFSHSMKIDNIVGFHITAIGQSHFCSLVDVILGSLRFSINAFTQKKVAHQQSASAILQQLSPLFHREKGFMSDGTKASPLSVWFSPKEVRAEKYRTQYIALRDYLEDNGIGIEQPI
jgi:hypothetical protein